MLVVDSLLRIFNISTVLLLTFRVTYLCIPFESLNKRTLFSHNTEELMKEHPVHLRRQFSIRLIPITDTYRLNHRRSKLFIQPESSLYCFRLINTYQGQGR